jgi:TnpA family transposase
MRLHGQHATTLRLETAEAEEILRRFTRGGPNARCVSGFGRTGSRGQTIFLSDYLVVEALRREIHEDCSSRELELRRRLLLLRQTRRTLTGDDREHQEISMSALHLLQSCAA